MGETYLDPALRAELERRGPANVREALRRTPSGGFVEFRRWFRPPLKMRQLSVEEWLREKGREAEVTTYEALKWAKIAGWAAIISALIGIAGIVVTLWTAGKVCFRC